MNNIAEVHNYRFKEKEDSKPPAPYNKLRPDCVADLCGDSQEVLAPEIAAVELLPKFRALARAICPRDKSTQDDLVQEMALAAFKCDKPNTVSFYCSLGVWRAHDYLRWWFGPMIGRWPGREDAQERSVATEETRSAVLERAKSA